MTKIAIITSTLALAGFLQAQTPEVNRRAENQQDRIAQGVESGRLSPRETAKVERKDAHINRQIRRDRAENGGRLTAKEKARINKEQNNASKKIYNEKHDQ